MVLDRSKKSRVRADGDFANTLPGDTQPADGFLGDWTRERDKDGSIYYVNQITQEATWTAPDGAYELKKLPGTISTYALVLGEGVASQSKLENRHHHHHRHHVAAAQPRQSLPATQRPSVAAAALQAGASLKSFALSSLQRFMHGTEVRSRAISIAEKKAKEREERKLYAILHEGHIAKDKRKWAHVTVAFLEANGRVTQMDNLICTVSLLDARDPDIVLEKITPKIPKPSGSKWDHFAKVGFNVPSPMCAVQVSFTQELPGKKDEKPPERAYGSIEKLVVAENSLQWYGIMDPVDSEGNPIPSEYDLGQIKIQLTREILRQKETSGGGDTAAEGLAGWEAKVTPEGRIFYINQGLDITQWNHPAMNDHALPHGWEHAIDAQGRKYYIDTESGKPGVEESRTFQYTNPAESQVAMATRHSTIRLQHDVTRVLRQKVDLNDASNERESIQALAAQRAKSEADKALWQDPRFESYEVRLDTFVRPMAIQTQNGQSFSIGGWPHGCHRISDRPELCERLKQQAIETAGSIKGVNFTSKSGLSGIIPILEGMAFVRAHDNKSARWDKLYLELRQIAEGGDDEILLMWGHLDPFNVHKTKHAMKCVGFFNSRLLTRASCIALTNTELDSIKMQHSALYRVRNLFGLELESGHDSMKFAFTDQETCKQWEANLGAPQLQRLGRLSPEIMARAGFIFAPRPSENQSDRCICPFCGLEAHGWRETDDPMRLHTEASSACKFIASKPKDRDSSAAIFHGLGSSDTSPVRFSVFSAPHENTEGAMVPLQSGSAISGSSFAPVPYLGRQVLGVAQEGHIDSTALQLQRLVIGDRESLLRGTESTAHQQALMEHRRRMHTVMHGDEGGRLLEMAAANQVEQVRSLLDAGAPIGFVDGGMRTALHWAAAFGHDQVVQLLLDRGANPSCKTVSGVTPLTLAEKGGYELCAYHIQVNGGIRYVNGWSGYMLAGRAHFSMCLPWRRALSRAISRHAERLRLRLMDVYDRRRGPAA